MDERKNFFSLPGNSPIVWPTIIVAVAGLYSYLTYQPPLDSVRPNSTGNQRAPAHTRKIPSTYARLWQDPLGREYDEIRAKWEKPEKGRSSSDIARVRDVLGETKNIDERTIKELLVMAVMLPGGASVDEAEQRRRTRYAIQTGLTTLQYRPRNSDRLHYFAHSCFPLAKVFGHWGERTTSENPMSDRMTVPYEWYDPDVVDSTYDPDDDAKYTTGVLVCWLDEDQMQGEPVAVLHSLLDDLKQDNCYPQTAVIGPSDTDAFFKIAENNNGLERHEKCEASQRALKLRKHITLFSPRATVYSRLLKNAESSEGDKNDDNTEKNNDENDEQDAAFAEDRLARFLHEPKAFRQVVRTIGTDRDLAVEIEQELRLRGAWPEKDAGDECVVLVTERDTLYGRAFPKMLLDPAVALDRKEQLLVFKYLRGIDGMLPGDNGDNPAGAEKTSDDEGEASRGFAAPTGRGQFDYLQRLETVLVRAHEERRYRGGRGITAIGVVGTDVYDKLLLLRALRKKFPQIPFFTTDLDENFDRQSEYETTRNLIVATHFGLSLHSDLQRDVPPFRDGYQTACFFSTLLALGDKRLERGLGTANPLKTADQPHELWGANSNDHLEPLVFEVGRHGSYQLTVTDSKDMIAPSRALDRRTPKESLMSRIHPASPRESFTFRQGGWKHWGWMALSIFALAAVMTTHFSKSPRPISTFCNACQGISEGNDRAKNLAIVIAVPVVVLIILAVVLYVVAKIMTDSGSPGGEPLEWIDGISVWPSTLIRLLAIMTCLGLGITAAVDLRRIRDQTCKVVLNGPVTKVRGKPVCESSADSSWRVRLGQQLQRLLWPTMPSIQDKSAAPTCENVFRRYFDLDKSRLRFVRSVLLAGLFAVFARAFYTATDEWPSFPYRGNLSNVMGHAILFAAIIAMFVLVFFVRDAILLCRRFVTRLSENESPWPDAATRIGKKQWHVARDEDLRELLMVRVIADRTNVVSKLLYYPFVVLLIMIVSRIPAFDYWTLPIPLVLVFGVLIVELVIQGFFLRIDAKKARDRSLARLRQNLSEAISRGGHNDSRKQQIENLIDEIKTESRGAFRPITEDPVFQAIAIPFGGAGGLMLIERLLH